jgi:glutamyl-tRNA synthetase
VRRRGIIPKAIEEFTIQIGISRAQPVFSWDLLLSLNRKLLDPVAKRYFFVDNPIKLVVEDAPKLVVKLKHHPDAALGFREIRTDGDFYIPRRDLVESGNLIRLKDLFNVKIIEAGDDQVIGRFAGRELQDGISKVQWTTNQYVPIEVQVPDLLYKDGKLNEHSLTIVKGYGEYACRELQVGEHVQFERFGFCRIDAKREDTTLACFTHK